uniref:Methyl-CpG-binding domain-containing protein 9 isoform X1 n=1 Tax=Rhizophora mucronata TaxID=61149 RepID=A0A2P2IJT7_RHIMU
MQFLLNNSVLIFLILSCLQRPQGKSLVHQRI